jgi:hypothetical protein
MSWLKSFRSWRRDRRVLKALQVLALERLEAKELIFKSPPADCYGYDCSNCRCDLAPDTQ